MRKRSIPPTLCRAKYERFQVTRKEAIPAPGLPDHYPTYLKPIPINTRDMKKLLDSYLDTEAPKVARWLYSSWTAQADQIKYQEVRNAIRDKQFSQAIFDQWRQDYSKFVVDVLAPKWRQGHVLSGKVVEDGINGSRFGESQSFSYSGKRVQAWIDQHGAELVTKITETQRKGLQEILRYYTVDRPLPAEDVARLIRPLIGLSEAGVKAVNAYRETLLYPEIGPATPAAEAEHMVQNYAHWLERRRALLIAETEMANAYNEGGLMAVRESFEEGWFGTAQVWKVWDTAEDERVCFSKFTDVTMSDNCVKKISELKPGDVVKTSSGSERVTNTMSRPYEGMYVLVMTSQYAVIATGNHPFKANGLWVRADDLSVNDRIDTLFNEQLNVDGIFKFKVTNSDDFPAVIVEVSISSEIFRGIVVPVDSIDFDGNTKIDEAEISAIPTKFHLLDKINTDCNESLSDHFFRDSFSDEDSIATMAAKLTVSSRRDNSEFFPTVFTFDNNRWSTAFFRAIVPIETLFSCEQFSASITSYIFGESGTALARANGKTMSDSFADLKIFTADKANFIDINNSFGCQVAVPTAEQVGMSCDGCELFTAGSACTWFEVCTMSGVATMSTKNTVRLLTLTPIEFLPAMVTFIGKRHGINLVTELYNIIHQQCPIVYNIEVEKSHEYYANGFLVHNCNTCNALNGERRHIDEPFSNGKMAPTAHPKCRCTLTYETDDPFANEGPGFVQPAI